MMLLLSNLHPRQVPCWVTHTNSRTHDIIRGGLESVARQQVEAAAAMNFSRWQTLVMVIATSLVLLAGRSQRPIIPMLDAAAFVARGESDRDGD